MKINKKLLHGIIGFCTLMSLMFFVLGASSQTDTLLINNGTRGTLSQTPTTTPLITANTNTSLHLNANWDTTDADAEYLNLTTLKNSPIFNNFTVTMWVYVYNQSFGTDGGLIGNKQFNLGATNYTGFIVAINSAGSIEFEVSNSTHYTDIGSGISAFRRDRWLMFTMKYTGINNSFWINGTEIQSAGNGVTSLISAGNQSNVSLDLRIGAMAQPLTPTVRAPNITYDEIRIYNGSLTTAQIQEIYNSGRIPNSTLPSTNLFAWYSMNENQGSVVYDKSGKGNNATLINSNLVDWDNEGGTLETLTNGTDYILNSTFVNLINITHAWNQLTATYSYGSDTINEEICENLGLGFSNLFSNVSIIFTLMGVIFVLPIIFVLVMVMRNIQSGGKVGSFEGEIPIKTITVSLLGIFVLFILGFTFLFAFRIFGAC